MGWKASASGKRTICASATQLGLESVGDALKNVIVDVNAMGRRDLGALPATVSPEQAASILWRKYVYKHNADLYYFAFDSSHLIPETRVTFLREERYKKPRQAPPIDWTITKSSMSLSWADAFSCGTTKATLWKVLAECLVDIIKTRASKGKAYVIDRPNGTKFKFPADTGIPEHNYGEADLKAMCMASECLSPTAIFTIDWDAVVQGVIVNNPNIYVVLGNVYPHSGGVAYTKSKAPRNSKATPEIIRPSVLGNSEPWSYGFALLAIGGVDYCAGLKRFGYREAELIKHLASCPPPKFFYINVPEDDIPVITFDLNAFLGWLEPVKSFRARSDSVEDLNNEIASMLYCLLYLGLVDRNRTCGGPNHLAGSDFFPGATTAADAFSAPFEYPPVHYRELYRWR